MSPRATKSAPEIDPVIDPFFSDDAAAEPAIDAFAAIEAIVKDAEAPDAAGTTTAERILSVDEVLIGLAEVDPGVKFKDLSAALSVADAKARATTADAGQARSERSTVAVGAIKAAFREKVHVTVVRSELLDAGVLKGTVSKIVTVLTALYESVIEPSDVKSLNGAYSLVKSVYAAAETASTAAAVASAALPTAAPAVVATTPDEALKIILNVITSEKNADKAFKLGGEWITKVTNAITELLRTVDDDELEE